MVYMFKDIAPKADHHFLIIPKKHMRDSSHIRSFEDMDLVEHMINVAHIYVRDNLKHYRPDDVSLHFHKPIFTMVKHLHMHVTVGPLTMAGNIFFCNCMSNDPKYYTKKYF